jgi:cytochrome c556
MKILTFIFALATAVLVAVCVLQGRKLAEQKSQLATAHEELGQNTAEIEKLQAAQKHAREQRDALLHQTDLLVAQIQTRPPAAAPVLETPTNSSPSPAQSATTGQDAAGFGKALAKMMQDPEMKKFMRTQQKMMVEQLYGPLAKKLNLTTAETDQFNGRIADNMMSGTEKATSLFGDGSSTNRTEAIEKLTANQKDFDEQMKSFLGDMRYAEYKDYQQTVGERAQLNLYKQQNASSENALTDEQTDQLLSLMKEEKQSAVARGEAVGSDAQDKAKLPELLADGQTDKFLQPQEGINQRVYDRARDLLTPAQLDSFGTFQTNQLQMMRMGMTMAKKMFAPEKASTETSPPSQ